MPQPARPLPESHDARTADDIGNSALRQAHLVRLAHGPEFFLREPQEKTNDAPRLSAKRVGRGESAFRGQADPEADSSSGLCSLGRAQPQPPCGRGSIRQLKPSVPNSGYTLTQFLTSAPRFACLCLFRRHCRTVGLSPRRFVPCLAPTVRVGVQPCAAHPSSSPFQESPS